MNRAAEQQSPIHDVRIHQVVIWLLYGLVAAAIVITYWRLPVTDFYHVSVEGLQGALGRALVFTNFPVAFAAIGLAWIAYYRIRANRAEHQPACVVATAATALCLVSAVPGVVDTGDLDARWINVVPAIGVLIALGLTIAALRIDARRPVLPWSIRDRAGLVIITILGAVSLPWVLADLGIDIDRVSLLDRMFMSSEVPEGETLRAVHLGHHHGLDGYLFVIAALVLGRIVRADRGARVAAALRAWFGFMFSYGILNLLEDAWLEQVVKRGWVDWELPDFLVPELSIGWAIILVGAVLAWLLLFRPIESERVPIPDSAGAPRSP